MVILLQDCKDVDLFISLPSMHSACTLCTCVCTHVISCAHTCIMHLYCDIVVCMCTAGVCACVLTVLVCLSVCGAPMGKEVVAL